MDPVEHDDAMVIIAIVVSRVEALVLLSVLDAAGIPAVAGGVHHASVEVNSIALGGHRIWVSARDWSEASAVLREAGADREWQFSSGLRRAVLRLIGVWLALYGSLAASAVIVGALPPAILFGIPLSALTIPVNPQGRGDYYLATDMG
jgi:hypothetical protein